MDRYIGTSGYSYEWWFSDKMPVRTFFPPKTKPKGALPYYSSNFNLMEINTSYYKIPTEKACKNWYETTPDSFRFLPKFPRSYTQYFKNIEDVFPKFYKSIQYLKHKLLGVLLQFSPNFIKKDKNIERLKEAAKYFKDYNIQVYIELRHDSWFDDCYELFTDLGWVLVITHSATNGWRPKSLVQTVPDRIMVRLHGTWKHSHGGYSDTQLASLAILLNKTPHVVVTFNNTDTWDGQIYYEGQVLSPHPATISHAEPHAPHNAKKLAEYCKYYNIL